MTTKVLPDDHPKVLKYSSGWSKDKSFIKGYDFRSFKGNENDKMIANAFDTIKFITFSFIDTTTKGRSKIIWRKWVIAHALWFEEPSSDEAESPIKTPVAETAWAVVVLVVAS